MSFDQAIRQSKGEPKVLDTPPITVNRLDDGVSPAANAQVGLNSPRKVLFKMDPKDPIGSTPVPVTSENMRDKYKKKRKNSKQFWMDDHACKVCFNCETPFTLFRRKHHCRVCGRIFCNACSSKTIDGTEYDYPGFVRVCNECYEFASKVKDGMGKQRNRSHQHIIEKQLEGIDEKERAQQASVEEPGEAVGIDTGDKNIASNGNVDDEEVNADGVEAAGMTQDSTLDLVELMNGESKLEGDDCPDCDLPNRPFDLAQRRSVFQDVGKRAVSFSFFKSGNRSNSFSGSSALTMDDTMQLNGRKATSAERQDNHLLKETLDQLRKEHESNKVFLEGDVNSAVKLRKGSFKRRFESAIERMAQREVDKLRDKRPSIILSESTKKEWQTMLVKLTQDLCSEVRASSMNFDSYCKIVTIPGGKVAESKFLNGIICHENIVNRMMRRSIARPRIMLLSSAIEFLREKNRISSLDTLLEQEQQYMELVVRKIASVGVDLLLVGNAVSRIAQQLLWDANISLVINVSMPLLERVSRLTGAFILPTTDHITKRSDPRGTCSLWELRTFSTKLSEAQNAEQLGSTIAINDRGVNKKTLMFFEGCPPQLGGSICLRGSSPTTLRQMERILTKLITAAYTLIQENAIFYDIGVVISTDVHSQALDDELLESSYLDFTKVVVQGTRQIHVTEMKRIEFGSVGSTLALGEFLRRRCFGSGVATTNTAPRGGAVNGVPPARLNRGAAASKSNANVLETVSSNSSTSPQTQQQSQQSQNTEDETQRGSVIGPPESPPIPPPVAHSPAGVPGGVTSAISPGLLQAVSRLEEENSTEESENPCAVYSFGTGRIFIFTGALSNAGPVQGPLRELLMNVRRDYVAKSIRKLQDIDSKQPWSMPIKRHSILTWSECSKCKATTNYRVLSRDAETLPFIRWLQLKFFYKAKNISSLFPESESYCNHSIFQDYVTYFEYMGKIAGFEHEKCIPYTVSLPNQGPSRVPLSNFASIWHKDMMERKHAFLLGKIKNIQTLFLDEKLVVYQNQFPDDDLIPDISTLVQSIQTSLNFQLDILDNKDNLLDLDKVRKELVELCYEWNHGLSLLREKANKVQTIYSPRRREKKPPLQGLFTALGASGDDASVSNDGDTELSEVASLGTVDTAEDTQSTTGSQNDLTGLALPSDYMDTMEQIKVRVKLLKSVSLSDSFVIRGRPSLPSGFGNRVVLVYDDEPTSWIAHALNSKEHRQKLFAQAESANHLENFQNGKWSSILTEQKGREDAKARTIDLTFHDKHKDNTRGLKFTVKTYCPLMFYALRMLAFKWETSDGKPVDPEISFLESLSRCNAWNATGGKSKSHFFKCQDGRFVAKSINNDELETFLQISSGYFSHLGHSAAKGIPSTLLRIVGVYTLISKDTANSSSTPVLVSHSSSTLGPDTVKGELVAPSPKTPGEGALPSVIDTPPLEESEVGLRPGTPSSQTVTSSPIQTATTPPIPGGVVANSSEEVPKRKFPATSVAQRLSTGVGEKNHFVVLEYLFEPGEEFEGKFDLKGNSRNRMVTNPKKGDVLLDCNFTLYTNGLPVPLMPQSKQDLVAALKSDTKFLEEQGIVDYSLLVGIPFRNTEDENESPTIKLGLLDYLQFYTYLKAWESMGKKATMIAGLDEPTITDPATYRSRLLKSMDRYFAKSPQPNITVD